MASPTLSNKLIEQALRRVNAERRTLLRRGDLKISRSLSFDFARVFLELLRAKYQKIKRGEDNRSFDDLMEDLLDALYCFEPDIRSGYRQMAGILLGRFGNLAQRRGIRRARPKNRQASRRLQGSQYAFRL